MPNRLVHSRQRFVIPVLSVVLTVHIVEDHFGIDGNLLDIVEDHFDIVQDQIDIVLSLVDIVDTHHRSTIIQC